MPSLTAAFDIPSVADLSATVKALHHFGTRAQLTNPTRSTTLCNMERPTPYIYGAALSEDECLAVRTRLATKASKQQPAAVVWKVLHDAIPNRLAHEVNRLRGIAFDSGECGFSHSFIEEPA